MTSARSFDLDAEREAALADLDTDPIGFTFKGERFTVRHPRLWPLIVEARLARGDLQGACLALIAADDNTDDGDGDDSQLAKWVERKPTVADAQALFDGIASATKVAADAGE